MQLRLTFGLRCPLSVLVVKSANLGASFRKKMFEDAMTFEFAQEEKNNSGKNEVFRRYSKAFNRTDRKDDAKFAEKNLKALFLCAFCGWSFD